MTARLVLLSCFGAQGLLCQPPISTRAGLIYYAEGDLQLDGRPLHKFIPMVRVAAGDTLRVDAGRAEILLQPRNFLRLAERSDVEVKSDLLSRVELQLAGVAILDVASVNANNSISTSCGEWLVQILRPGIYRFDCPHDALASSMRVDRGRARVRNGGRSVEVTANQRIVLGPGMDTRSVKGREPDGFDQWSALRAALMSRSQGLETILLDTYKPPEAGVIIVPGEKR